MNYNLFYVRGLEFFNIDHFTFVVLNCRCVDRLVPEVIQPCSSGSQQNVMKTLQNGLQGKERILKAKTVISQPWSVTIPAIIENKWLSKTVIIGIHFLVKSSIHCKTSVRIETDYKEKMCMEKMYDDRKTTRETM